MMPADCNRRLRALAWAFVAVAMLLLAVLSQRVERTPDERNYQFAGRVLLERNGLHTVEQRFQGPLILLGTQLSDDRAASVHDDAVLQRARLGMLAFPLLLLLVVVRWTREALGDRAACVAAFFAACNPALLAYGPLLSSDVAFTAAALAAAWLWWRWRQRPGALRLGAFAVALGATLATKYTGALAAAVLGLLTLAAPLGGLDAWPRRDGAARPLAARLAGAAAALLAASLLALLVLYACYLFASPPFAASTEPLLSGLLSKVATLPGGSWLLGALPEPMVLGIDYQLRATGVGPDGLGNGTFLDLRGNHAAYYPVTLLCKTPPTLLLTALVGAFVARRSGSSRGLWTAALLPPLGLLLYCSGTRALQMGIRYVLPMVPAMWMLAAAALSRPWLRGRVGGGVLALVAITSLWSVASSWPHHVGYFPDWCGGQTGGYRIVADGNLDWYQRQVTGREALAARHPELEFLRRNQGPRFGKVAVYTEDLQLTDPLDPSHTYHWLWRFEPFDHDSAAWLCYDVDAADFERAIAAGDGRAADDLAMAWLLRGDVPAARRALRLDPDGRRDGHSDTAALVALVDAAGIDIAKRDAAAHALRQRGQLELALTLIDRDARANAQTVALMLFHTGRAAEGIDHYERVTADDRTMSEVFQLAWLLCDGGPGYAPQPMRALELMQRGPAPAAGSPELSAWQELLGRVEQAVERERRVEASR
ncbi:MAG: glycosyltransferase family 39 protein [Planctomycetota bacterium]